MRSGLNYKRTPGCKHSNKWSQVCWWSIYASCLTLFVTMLLKFEIIQEDTDYLIAHRENGCHGGLSRVGRESTCKKESRETTQYMLFWCKNNVGNRNILTIKTSHT